MKFILLGHPRSGSTLVTTTLQQHPDVRMFGELFHTEFQNRLIAYQWGIACRPSTDRSPERLQAWTYTDQQDGHQFLDELVYADPSRDRPAATGFKLFYDHARTGRAATAWDYLREHREVKIVHLVRHNLLDCLISTLTAESTSVWEVEADSDEELVEPAPLRIPVAECEAYFERLTDLRRRAVDDLAGRGRQVLELGYEQDVAQDFDAALRRVQEFLEVPVQSLPPMLRKLSRQPARRRLTNYDELSRHFARTPAYASYFFPDPSGATRAPALHG